MVKWNKILDFLKESKFELKKVNWPTKEETIKYTGFVIFLSLLVAAFLGILDFIFVQVIQKIVF
jgi:preprotein translocase subunit SecE